VIAIFIHDEIKEGIKMRENKTGVSELKMDARKGKNIEKTISSPKVYLMIMTCVLATALFLSSIPLAGAVKLEMNQNKLTVSQTGDLVANGSIYTTVDTGYSQTSLRTWGLTGAGHIYIEPASGSNLYLTDHWDHTGQLNIQFGSTSFQTGNVGIGTTTPTQKLDVRGNVNISATGILYAPQICLAGTCKTEWPSAGTGTVDWSGITNKPAFAANAVSGRVRVYEVGCGSGYASSCDAGTNGYVDYADSAGTVTTPVGTYKHLGAWGVGRTAAGAILVNTAYTSDYATTASNGVPSGMIAMFDSACPAGWTRFAALDGRFAQGSTVYGGTGGAATHTHAVDPPITDTSTVADHKHTQTGGGLLGGPGPHEPAEEGFQTSANGGHSHTVNIASFASDAASSLPPYVNVIFCRKD